MLHFLRFFSYLNQLWAFILIVLCVHRFAGVCWVCPAALNFLKYYKYCIILQDLGTPKDTQFGVRDIETYLKFEALED